MMIMSTLDKAIHHEALFTSSLQSSQHPDARQVRAAVRHTLRAIGPGGCVAQVAQEFGDHPDTAVARMRWARDAVHRAYSNSSRHWFECAAARAAARSA
jgi:hypothetical protein